MERNAYLRVFIVLALAQISSAMFAGHDFIGIWRSKEIKEDTERVTIEYIFKDSTKMEMAFITDNQIPQVGRCVSRISVQGTYSVVGPMMFTEIEKKTLLVIIEKLELAGEMEKNTPKEMIPTLKEYLQKQMELTATTMFAPFNGGSMIYAIHEGTDDVVSFIIGDSQNSMDIEFTRQK